MEIDPNLDQLATSLANLGKRWWFFAVMGQFAVIILGMVGAVWGQAAWPLVLIAGGLSILVGFVQWRADRLKRAADTVRRKFEMHNGLGWPVSTKDLSDVLATVPRDIRDKVYLPSERDFFASKAAQSPQRILANLVESSWWSKHLAGEMGLYAAALCLIIAGIAVAILIASMQAGLGQPVLTAIAKMATSIIVFLFAGGYFRLSFDYQRFSREAERVEDRALALSERPDLTEVQAISLLHDYQIARAGAPAIPTWTFSYTEGCRILTCYSELEK